MLFEVNECRKEGVMSTASRLASIVLLVIALAGCASSDFVRPSPELLQLGETRFSQVIDKMGAPDSKSNIQINGDKILKIGYGYASWGGGATVSGAIPFRDQEFFFHEKILVGHRFVSSFMADSTDFNETKVDQLKKGVTTRAEVVALFGKPTTRRIAPITEEGSVETIGYAYGVVRSTASQSWKELIIEIDERGIVTDFSFGSQGTH
jgi:outer membrane protein assembly factor BamE (lipoprotein component of BamABCDE complex)